MSRIGKKPILIPNDVQVTVQGNYVAVKGPKGDLALDIHPIIEATVENNAVVFSPKRVSKKSKALWGLYRALVANMVVGVTNGFEKKLIFEGIGFRVQPEGDRALVMQLGFSHPVRFEAPQGVSVSVQKNVISVSGIHKEAVGNTAAKIRALKPPEPYKGKGIRYEDEVIRRKAGKKAATTG